MTTYDFQHGTLGRGLPFLSLGAGPPLVVLPGLTPDHDLPTGLSRRFQIRDVERWAATRRVWWINRRSGLPADVTMADLAADYAEVLAATFDGPVEVMGTSTGGSVAQQLVLNHPQLVKRLVLVSTAYRLGAWGREMQRRIAQMLSLGRRRAAGAAMFAPLGASQRTQRLFGRFGWLVGPRYLGNRHGDLMATIWAEDRFDVGERIGEIKCPTLVVGGDRDAYYDDGRLIVETAGRIPGARLALYAGRGHMGVEFDRRVRRDVLTFLGE